MKYNTCASMLMLLKTKSMTLSDYEPLIDKIMTDLCLAPVELSCSPSTHDSEAYITNFWCSVFKLLQILLETIKRRRSDFFWLGL